MQYPYRCVLENCGPTVSPNIWCLNAGSVLNYQIPFLQRSVPAELVAHAVKSRLKFYFGTNYRGLAAHPVSSHTTTQKSGAMEINTLTRQKIPTFFKGPPRAACSTFDVNGTTYTRVTNSIRRSAFSRPPLFLNGTRRLALASSMNRPDQDHRGEASTKCLQTVRALSLSVSLHNESSFRYSHFLHDDLSLR